MSIFRALPNLLFLQIIESGLKNAVANKAVGTREEIRRVLTQRIDYRPDSCFASV